MPNSTAQRWIDWLRDFKVFALNQAADSVNLAAFIVAQQERVEQAQKDAADARAQMNVWRLLAAERLEQIKNFQQQGAGNG